MQNLIELSERLPVIFSMHPRTEKNLIDYGIMTALNQYPKLNLCQPIGYFESISLSDKARFVLTDSGGLQEETTVLKVPCLTLRPNTERPITITVGTNKLTSLQTMRDDIDLILKKAKHKYGSIPELWDGQTSQRILNVLNSCSS
jgi:UDP-N-acetylglucosamine 2-epimerase (non-hydrolysing)